MQLSFPEGWKNTVDYGCRSGQNPVAGFVPATNVPEAWNFNPSVFFPWPSSRCKVYFKNDYWSIFKITKKNRVDN